ncbi:MAG: trypsin-like peptidase domain-containing protein [Candidatus Cloacimonetes bacterium]|nr:trypsin-like peptidase domain-containing protein [Candidatus Cloacimonadota bacterium]MCF7813947.1 trypsin-like peptidase domain-containing protein [Candidatus Cloacimonadota bacterium]MCF7868041.1 trypsin-like peptidase domain-containing protein [Candidatus Cloacimonadota bacterium]MCF7883961.1 trypsin-like peptidase domain-containing protein [Candidatus Cloacimonadota bacterium]
MKKNDIVLIIAIIIIALFIYSKFEKRDNLYVPEQLNTEFFEQEPKQQPEKSSPEERQQMADEIRVSRQNSITKAVELIEPAVVSVNVIKTKIVRRRMGFFFGYYNDVPYNVKSLGSGVLFSKDGYILTNAHVVEGATEIKVILTDDRQFDGELIGVDSVHDVAVVKIEGENLPFATLGTSSDLIIGEWAIAVGNPYGFVIKDSKPSVSVGVISAVNRDFAENKEGKVYRRMIQTDTAINQGNSGGPLVNIFGEVIGLNTFILSESGGSIGIGFSIPIDRVKKITTELIKYGKIRDIWFGFKVQDINPMLAQHFKLDTMDGVLVNFVEEGAPSYKAGLRKGDIIIDINGQKITNTEEAELSVTDISVGDKIKIIAIRNGKEIDILIDAVEYK